MKRAVFWALLLIALCYQPVMNSDIVPEARAGIGPGQRERLIEGIEYLLGEVEFYMEHDVPRSLSEGEVDAPR